jgi:phosphoribosylaminoimidazole-succinocarboxamide synthase
MDFQKPRYTPMSRRRRIYEGKAKILYEGPEPGTLIQHFKDDATAFNAKKHEVIEGKGVLNNRISARDPARHRRGYPAAALDHRILLQE